MHLAACRGWPVPRPSPWVPQGQPRPWASAATCSLETSAVGTVPVPCSFKVPRLDIAKWDTEKDKLQAVAAGTHPPCRSLSAHFCSGFRSSPAWRCHLTSCIPRFGGALRHVLSTPYSVRLLWPDVGRGGEKCPLMRGVKSASYMDHGVPFPDLFHGILISCNTF